jgi:hypothetical protein
LLATIVLGAVPVVFAITLHEAARVVADSGDQTDAGAHVKPDAHRSWTILVPGMLVAVAAMTYTPAFIFGWAKPVP